MYWVTRFQNTPLINLENIFVQNGQKYRCLQIVTYNFLRSKIDMYRRIRDLREDKDYTQQYVAEKLSYTHSAYSKIERGERVLTAEILVQLSNLYDVSTDYLLGLTDFPDRVITKR